MKTINRLESLLGLVCLSGALGLSPLTANPAGSSDLVPIFGPERFTRAPGKPVTVMREFDTAGCVGPYYLVIQNGTTARDAISSAVVVLNDDVILDATAFNRRVFSLEREISLGCWNRLTVQLRSQPGASLTVTLLGAPNPGNLVMNGDFEVPGGVTQWRALFQSPVDFEWHIVESTSIDLVGPPWQAASGLQFVDLDGNFPGAGGVFQDLPTQPGATYRLRFAMAGNPQWQEYGVEPIKTMDVYWDDSLLASLTADVTGRTISDMGWQYYEFDVTATGFVTRLLFISTMGYSATGPTLDDVSVHWLCP